MMEGFVRALQGDLITAAVVVLITLLLGLIGHIAVRFVADEENKHEQYIIINLVGAAIIALTLLVFLGHALFMAATNRVPRKDVDKGGVYEQMESHTAPTTTEGK